MERYDKLGHCTVCGKCMVTEQVIDNQVQYRFSADYREKEFLVSDGSKMRVAICLECRDNLTEKDYKNIMKCVYNGWKEEIKTLDWDKEKKEKYLNDYSKIEIISEAEGKDPNTLNKEFEEFLKKKSDLTSKKEK